MPIHLTSFKKFHESNRGMKGYSVAVYQPKWFTPLPELRLFDIRKDGQWIRPRNFMTDDHDKTKPDEKLLWKYHDALTTLYTRRLQYPQQWKYDLDTLEQGRTGTIALCCWCPNDVAAKRQLEDYGSFVCHTWPIESILIGLGFSVVRDLDRKKMIQL